MCLAGFWCIIGDKGESVVTKLINIGTKQRQMRMIFGVVAFAIGAGALVALKMTGAAIWWRLALFIPFWMGGIGVFQSTEKT